MTELDKLFDNLFTQLKEKIPKALEKEKDKKWLDTMKKRKSEKEQLKKEKKDDQERVKKKVKEEAKTMSKEHVKKNIGKKEIQISAYSRKGFETEPHKTKGPIRIISWILS